MTISKNKKRLKVDDTTANLKLKGGNYKKSNRALSGVDCGSGEDDDYPIGTKIIVCYRDGSNRVAKVIERSKEEVNNDNKDINKSSVSFWQYYVHYDDFNRRMDEWVDASRVISIAPSAVNTFNASDNITDENEIANKSVPESIALSSPNNSKSKITTVSELDHDEHEGLDETSLLEHEEITKVKNIKYVVFGRSKIECWYYSPFPEEIYSNGKSVVECLYFCEFTLRFFKTKNELIRYQHLPNLPRHPPGNEIYRDEHAKLSMFELDGAVEKIYCQNLCYFAKLFLDHKTLYWDVDTFLFYVLCTYDNRGFHPVGYFSKEKYSDLGYNLACILAFPCFQRQGYGRFLINFSYELSKKEEKIGSPEKPLSDLGAVSYKSYWANSLLAVLNCYSGTSISILDLTRLTSILAEDVIATLQMLGLLLQVDDSSESGVDVIHHVPQKTIVYCPPEHIENLMKKYPTGSLQVDSSRLHWAPLYISDPKKDKWSIKSYTGAVNLT